MFVFFLSEPTEVFLLLGTAIFLVFLLWMICTKAGFPGWYALAGFVPILNFLLLYYLA